MPARAPDDREVSQAERLYRETEALVGPAHPEALKAQEALGDAYLNVHDFAAAKVTFEQAYLRRVLERGEDNVVSQRDAIKLSVALRELGECARALALEERAAEVLEGLYGPDGSAVWHAMEQQRQTLLKLGRPADAVGLQEVIAARKVTALGHHVEAARSLFALGKLRVEAGDLAGANEAYTQGAAMAEDLDMPVRMRLDTCRLRLDLAKMLKDWPVAADMTEMLLARYRELDPDDDLRLYVQRARPLLRISLKAFRVQAAKQAPRNPSPSGPDRRRREAQWVSARLSARPWAMVFQLKVAHLMRTGNLTTPWRAASSPRFSRLTSSRSTSTGPAVSSAGPSPEPSSARVASWIDIMALKVRISRSTSASDLPFTAADMRDAEDWLIEQPVPLILMSTSRSPSTSSETTTSSPHSGLKPSTRWAGGTPARPGSGASGSGPR